MKLKRKKRNPDAVETFRAFNRREPKHLRSLNIPDKEPFVYIGPVPELHYLSKKEGKKIHYFHRPETPPVLYYHPTKPIGILVGGSMRLGDWFYG